MDGFLDFLTLQEPSNFAIIRKTVSVSQTKNSQKPHSHEIYITNQVQTISLKFIRAKCVVQHKSQILDIENFVSFDKHYFYDKCFDNSNGNSDITPIIVHESSPNMKNYLSSHFQFQFLESEYQSNLLTQENDKPVVTKYISNQSKSPKTLSIMKSKKKEVNSLSSNSNGISSSTEKRKVGRPRKRPLSSIIPSIESSSYKTTTEAKQQGEKISQSKKNLSIDIDSLENSSNEKYSVISDTEDTEITHNGASYQKGEFCYYNSMWRSCIGLIIDISLDASHQNVVTLRLFFDEKNLRREYPLTNISVRGREIVMTDEIIETKILNLGQKCTVQHIRAIEDLQTYVSHQEHFWYEYIVTEDGNISDAPPT